MVRAAIKVEYIISEKQVPCSRVANYKIVDRDATKRGIVKNMWESKCIHAFLLNASLFVIFLK